MMPWTLFNTKLFQAVLSPTMYCLQIVRVHSSSVQSVAGSEGIDLVQFCHLSTF